LAFGKAENEEKLQRLLKEEVDYWREIFNLFKNMEELLIIFIDKITLLSKKSLKLIQSSSKRL